METGSNVESQEENPNHVPFLKLQKDGIQDSLAYKSNESESMASGFENLIEPSLHNEEDAQYNSFL